MDLGRLLTLLASWMALTGCPSTPEPAKEPTPFTVYAVNYPLAYFAERLAPSDVEVVFPTPPNVDPAYWRPTPDTIVEFQNADRILLNGAGYAGWTRTSTLPRSKTIVTATGCRDVFLPTESTAAHRHGPEGEHSHGATSFTTWLDLELAACQARHVRDALVRARPDDAADIRSKWVRLERDLRDLDATLRKATTALGQARVLASHPVYAYLGDAYGLDIRSFHLEPDEPLDSVTLAALDSATKDHEASLMLWEAEPLPATRKTLEGRGIRVVVFDPSANRPSDGDFLSAMRQNVEHLHCATKVRGCP